MSKSIPLSLRISHDDAEFIANLQINDALTPSDKIRAIIKEAKSRREHAKDYAHCRHDTNEWLAPLKLEMIKFEGEQHQYSELINQFNDWLADAFAYVTCFKVEPKQREADLRQLEQGIAKRVFRLFEIVARMVVTLKAPCYDQNVLLKQIEPLIELSKIINAKLKEKEHE